MSEGPPLNTSMCMESGLSITRSNDRSSTGRADSGISPRRLGGAKMNIAARAIIGMPAIRYGRNVSETSTSICSRV